MVQSWAQNDWVTPTLASGDPEVVNTNAGRTSYTATDAQITAMQNEITAIFNGQNSHAITMSSFADARDAASSSYRAYTVNVSGVMNATLGDNYNLTTDQKLVVSALALSDTNNDYHFYVATRADLATMAAESAALNGIGVTSASVAYTQTADISGVADGSYVIYNGAVVSMLYGSFNGNGYTLSDFMITGSGTKVGFFGEVTNGVTGVNLRYVTVISTGTDAKVGAIAAVTTTVDNSTAQGHIYVSNESGTSTVGFLVGETSGVVTSSKAVGYVKVLGGTVTVGGAVGSASEAVAANTFVEINKLGSANITAGGIVGDGSVDLTGSSYLAGSLSDANTVIANTGATELSYASILTSEDADIAALRDGILTGFVMKRYYVDQLRAAYTISNYRQLAIMEMYSWATYTLGADIELPYSYGSAVHAGEFAYAAIDENGKKIYSSAAGTFMGVVEEVR